MMKKFVLLLMLIAGSAIVNAQDKSVEQLKKELAAHPKQDTFRVNRLIELSYSTDLKLLERKEIAAEALAISRKIGYRHGEGIALTNLGYYLVRLGKKEEGDSLLSEAGLSAKKTADPEINGILNYRLGLILHVTTGDKKALEYFSKAEEEYEKSGNYTMLANCQTTTSNYYLSVLSNYPLAMEYLLKSIHSAEKSNSPSLLIQGTIDLAYLYSMTGDHENAIAHLRKAEQEMKNTKTGQQKISYLQNAIGEAYRLSGRYKEAIPAYKLAIKHSNINDGVDESNLADVYTHLDSLSLAFQYGFSSLSKMKESGNTKFLGWIYGIMARAYLKKAMPDSSIYYARMGLDSATRVGTIEFMRDNAAALANAYAYKKDFAKAYPYHLQYINYRDSMLNTEVRNRTAVLKYNNDLGKKEAQISQLNMEKKGQRNFLISVSVILGLIVISAIGMLRSIRQKQKANKLLQKQKQEIDDKARELSLQKENLQQSHNNVELLGEIGRKISSSLSVEKIISTVYNNVNSLMDAAVFGIGIYHEESKTIDFPATYENGQALPAYSNSIYDQNRFAGLCFISGNEIVMGDLSTEYSKYLQTVPVPVAGDQPVSLIYLPLKLKEKMFGVITVQSFKQNAFSDYQLYMLRNIAVYAAIALENAESFKKLNETVDSLQKTQKQLIQSEKMASLGELTAGIAHEIQNPLNFINNFSEVNKELIEDMKLEIEGGNYAEAVSIAKNIANNQEKINHHGKRADGIVKGMLQHSRTSSGHKEPTDINALCDEYLRLAYHGLRAKDKSFNAKFETRLDPSAGKINMVPQEMGRVILNLINNAFYAVSEKKKQTANSSLNGEAGQGYEPLVTVSTKKLNDGVEISVMDNGKGIPETIREKIFQPFFTTKPTGSGTGLGLSLSYDIIRAHEGDIRVETKEPEGTTFTIQL